jgi:hypothetical protein
MLAIGTANYVPFAFRNGNQYNARIDHELRPGKDRLYGSIYRTPSRSVTGDIRPADNRPTSQASDFASLNYTHIFSPRFINEFRAGVARTISNQDLPPHPDVPSLTITGLSSVISQNFFPSKYAQTGFNYSDIFSLVRSSHSLKMGAEVRRTWSNSYNTRFFIPNYSFYSIVDFADNDPYQETRTVDPRTGNPITEVVGMRDTEFALFVADDWKVTRNFTVNVGLRYENYGSPTEVNGLLRNIAFGPGSNYAQSLATASAQIVNHFYPTGNLDFAPRLGLAWNPDGKGRTAVRGGYGIAYNKLGDTALLNFRGDPPLAAIVNVGRLFGTPFTYSLGAPGASFLGYPVDSDLRQGLNAQNGINGIRASLYGVDPKFAMAYTHNWFFGIQHEFGAGWTLDVNYLGTGAHHLPIQINMNRFAGDLLNGGVFHGLNQSFADIQMVQSTGNSIYNGMTAHLKHASGHGFVFDTAYTFGKAIDNADVVGSSTSGNPTYADVNNRALERGPTGYDVRQKLAFSGVWDLPFFKGRRGIVARALGHWEFSGIGILQTGTPIDVTSSAAFPKGDWNADGQNGDRPNAPGPGLPRSGFSRSAFLTGIFTAAQFPSPTLGTDGNLGRNVFRGPGFAEVDLLVARKFRVSERIKAELRGEAFNALNRVNLANPVTDLSSSSFGRSTSQLTPRQYQLILRVSF